jgi:hypothetical protein
LKTLPQAPANSPKVSRFALCVTMVSSLERQQHSSQFSSLQPKVGKQCFLGSSRYLQKQVMV